MNKNYTLIAFCMLLVFTANAQQPKTSLLYNFIIEKDLAAKTSRPYDLFEKKAVIDNNKAGTVLLEKLVLTLNRKLSFELFNNKPARISLSIPSINGNAYELELARQDINTSGEFSFGTIEGKGTTKKTGIDQGLHYRGYILGDPLSIASFSVFASGETMGLFCNSSGNFNLGRQDNDTGDYILYNSTALLAAPHFNCAASEIPVSNSRYNKNQKILPAPTNIIPPLLCKKVRIYWEADYKLYNNNFGSDLAGTADYLTGLFNQVAVMYQNEGIFIELTDRYVWITPDPYNTTTSGQGLDDFQARWNALGDNFKADLAVLIDGSPTNNGGIAYLLTDELCARDYAYGYANVYGTFNTVPAYSWDVEVVTHEMGHLVGSHHTQWCGWNTGAGGGCGAIDNCVTTESSGSCSSCNAFYNTNPNPPLGFKGTVMSYCHLRSGIGINLANGFGPLPQAAIRNTINNAACALYDNKWTGAVSTAWEDPANWGCGMIPDENTDVTISGGLTNYPVVNSAAICRRLIEAPGTTVLVRTGFTLMVAGQPE